jgi:gamma-glutamylputrescine oxidase
MTGPGNTRQLLCRDPATPLDPFAPLRGEVRADVCRGRGRIHRPVGGAAPCRKAGLSVVLLEAHRVGFGASGRNGGQVGSGQRQDQDWIEKYTDAEVDHARAYADHLATRYNYTRTEVLDRPGIRHLIGSDRFSGGALDHGAGHIHPLNFAIGLAKAASAAGVRIHEESEVLSFTPGPKATLKTAQGSVTADHVILAGNGYIGGLEPSYPSRVMPINNFIIATEPLGDRAKDVLAEPIAVADSNFVVNYWRLSDDNRLLFGGGESYGYRFPDILKTVRAPMLKIYPQLADVKITHAWGGTLAITMNRMPALMRPHPNVLAGSACSGHGVALSTLTGKLLAETVTGNAEGYDLLASVPQPRFPGGAALRWPLLVLAMTWYSMRDRLGL